MFAGGQSNLVIGVTRLNVMNCKFSEIFCLNSLVKFKRELRIKAAFCQNGKEKISI